MRAVAPTLTDFAVSRKALLLHLRGFVTGLALLALMLQGLLPLLHNSGLRRAGLGAVESLVICTAYGFVKISLDADGQTDPDSGTPAAARVDCPICLGAQHMDGLLPPVAMALEFPLLLQALRYSLWIAAPPPGRETTPARARGPPLIS